MKYKEIQSTRHLTEKTQHTKIERTVRPHLQTWIAIMNHITRFIAVGMSLSIMALAATSCSTGTSNSKIPSSTLKSGAISDVISQVGSSDSASPAPTAAPTVDPDAKYVALTFDDGPCLDKTERLLSILKEKNAKATFFVLGKNAATYPDIIRNIDTQGHEIGNHSYDHTLLTKSGIALKTIESQLDRTNEIVKGITGKTPISFRPPNGSYNTAVIDLAKARGMSLYNWSFQSCPEDWKNKDPKVISKIVVDNAKNGHIVLLHDLHDYTIDAVPAIIDGLRAKGFEFVTVSELVAKGPDKLPIPGKVYFYYNTPTKK
jgi:peptidoglycan/xylan/chitin deacetylase (PgdA/CDA1 family)